MNSKVSIIIRTKNEEKYIHSLLHQLELQDYENFEIIVIDSGSTDRTIEIAKKCDVKPKIIKIKPEDFTFGYSLNVGCREAKGEYIAFLSAHTILKNNNWLSKMVEGFNYPNVGGIYGKQLPIVNNIPEERDTKLFFPNETRIYKSNPLFHNANSIIRKDIWEKIPFNEKLNGLEDIDWAQKVINSGYSIVYEPEAIVYHYHEESLEKIYNRAKREAFTIKKLQPQLKQSFIGFLFKYFIYIFRDFTYGIKHRKNLKDLFAIPFTRFAKNYGIYIGLVKKDGNY